MTHDNTQSSFSFRSWFLVYTFLFLFISVIIWRPFYFDHKSMIWGYDGLYQTYGSMVYFSQYWRDFLFNLCSGNPSLPMVDTSLGMGFDILTTLNYYGFGDPLEWISLLFSKEQMEVCYNLLVFLRYYLSGLFFGVYCLGMKKQWVSSFSGAFAYAFSGFALYAGVRHPYFMNPWMYFPLLCLGVEQVLKGKKGVLLAVVTGLSAWSNFYFFYMLSILTFSYAVIRFRFLYGKRWKSFFRLFLKGCFWYLLGIGLGCVILVPIVFAFSGSARTGGVTPFANTWFAYPLDFYKELLIGYVFPVYSANFWCVLVYPSAAFLGLFAFGKKNRQMVWLLVWFGILSLVLWIPLGGLAMNGFSYVSHRWIFGYGFVMALLLVFGIEHAECIRWKPFLIYSGLFFILAFLFVKNGGSPKRAAGFALIFVIQALALFFLKKGKALVVALCVLSSIILSANTLYSQSGYHYSSSFQETGSALSQMSDLSEVQMQPLETPGSFFRVEGDTTQVTNWGMVTGRNGTNSYFSLTKREMHDYALDMENPDLKFSSWYNGLGDRAMLMSLGCVRYFAKAQDSVLAVPYGYSLVETAEGLGTLYETPYAMPIGYTYDSLITEEAWNRLSAIEKQQALMQAALLSEKEEAWCLENGICNNTDLSFVQEPLPYTLVSTQGVWWNREEGKLLVEEGGGEISLQFESRPNSETYLRICGYDIEPSGAELLHFYAGLEGTELKKIYCTSSLSSWNGKLKNFLVSVTDNGQPSKPQIAKLSFPFAGEFILKDLEMYTLPMENFSRQALERKQESMEADLIHNQLTGRIHVSGNRILCVSIPYSKGWTAKVDGVSVPVWKCNDLYLGVFLEAGDHHVQLSYETPGLLFGAAVSLFSFFVLLGILLSEKILKNCIKHSLFSV